MMYSYKKREVLIQKKRTRSHHSPKKKHHETFDQEITWTNYLITRKLLKAYHKPFIYINYKGDHDCVLRSTPKIMNGTCTNNKKRRKLREVTTNYLLKRNLPKL